MLDPQEIRDRLNAGIQRFPSKRFSAYSQVPDAQWRNWEWHLLNRVSSLPELEKCLYLTQDEKEAFKPAEARSRVSLTPYWISLMDANDANCPIRRQGVPSVEELKASSIKPQDYAPEGTHVAGGRLIHSHPDRALLKIHSQCAVYCRFCPQKVQDPTGQAVFSESDWIDIIFYLENHPQIRELVLTGGDPLLFQDGFLKAVLLRLKSVSSIQTLRLETRALSFLPQRITPPLVQILKTFQTLYLVLHVNHPREISPEFKLATKVLSDAGIPLVSQTVLLRGVNDRTGILSELFFTLYRLRVRPYRLAHCSSNLGGEHFQTSVAAGMKLMDSLRSRMTDLALPEFVVETAGGKIPLRYDPILSRSRKQILVKNKQGKIYVYAENFSRITLDRPR